MPPLRCRLKIVLHNLGVFREGHNNFFVGRRNFGVEGDVCRSEICDRSVIISRSGGEVGDGVRCFLLVKMISRIGFPVGKGD